VSDPSWALSGTHDFWAHVGLTRMWGSLVEERQATWMLFGGMTCGAISACVENRPLQIPLPSFPFPESAIEKRGEV